jgi:hypothetical protein
LDLARVSANSRAFPPLTAFFRDGFEEFARFLVVHGCRCVEDKSSATYENGKGGKLRHPQKSIEHRSPKACGAESSFPPDLPLSYGVETTREEENAERPTSNAQCQTQKELRQCYA